MNVGLISKRTNQNYFFFHHLKSWEIAVYIEFSLNVNPHLWELINMLTLQRNVKKHCLFQTHLLLSVMEDCVKPYRTEKRTDCMAPFSGVTHRCSCVLGVLCLALGSTLPQSAPPPLWVAMDSTALSPQAPLHWPLRLVHIKQPISYVRLLTHVGLVYVGMAYLVFYFIFLLLS